MRGRFSVPEEKTGGLSHDLINIRRVAWGVRDVEGARQSHCTISETVINALAAEIMKKLM